MPDYLEAAVAAGHVSLLPDSVKNLLALNSLQARWAPINVGPVQNEMGFRIYHNTQPMKFSARYVCVGARATLAEWIDGVHRWEHQYGPSYQ